MAHLEIIGQFFKVRHSQSVLIFSILNHPCSCLVYYHLFGVFYLRKLLHVIKTLWHSSFNASVVFLTLILRFPSISTFFQHLVTRVLICLNWVGQMVPTFYYLRSKYWDRLTWFLCCYSPISTARHLPCVTHINCNSGLELCGREYVSLLLNIKTVTKQTLCTLFITFRSIFQKYIS